jgi:uncharacterized membrane protein YedE/YeeE
MKDLAVENFTPLTASLGGILIGVSVTLLWAGIGRTAGISGIGGGVFPHKPGDLLWRLSFLIGLPIGAVIGSSIGPPLFAEIPDRLPVVDTSPLWMLIAGLLAGIGTRLAKGCTSGHGICGISRLSKSSFAAVGIFMTTAGITVFLVRHVFA